MLGIFLNNTNSDIKYYINLNNYNNLKKYFDKAIILDVNSQYSIKLQKTTNIQILPNIYNISDYQSIIKDLDLCSSYTNIVFINDNNIYLNNFDDYFKYINKNGNRMCPYCDLYENDIFSIKVGALSLDKTPFLKISYLNINDERIYK